MSEVTQLLHDWSAGRQEARDELLRLVYDPLRAIAGRHLHREREGHTLQPTALVHEPICVSSTSGASIGMTGRTSSPSRRR